MSEKNVFIKNILRRITKEIKKGKGQHGELMYARKIGSTNKNDLKS